MQQAHHVVARLPGRRAVAARHDAHRPLQRLQPALHLLDLLVGMVRVHPFVGVAVVGDFVPALHDHLRAAAMVLGRPAGDEERGLQSGLVQHVQDLWHADLGAVCALAERAGTAGVLRVARQPKRLGVEVEGQHDGDLRAAGPPHRLVDDPAHVTASLSHPEVHAAPRAILHPRQALGR